MTIFVSLNWKVYCIYIQLILVDSTISLRFFVFFSFPVTLRYYLSIHPASLILGFEICLLTTGMWVK